MRYNDFGKTGVKISALGFGCMRLPMVKIKGKDVVDEEISIKMIHRAYELGVNYFDSAWFYNDQQSEGVLGKSLKGIRDKVYVSTKSPGHLIKKPGDYRRILEEQLRRLDIDYIDFYHFHGIGYDGFYEVDKRSGWIREAAQAKSEGLFKHISFSFHDAPENMIKLVDTGIFESVLAQYNIIDRSNEEALAYARSKGLGTVVMGPLGGGRAAGLPAEVRDKLGLEANSSAEMALRFVFANENINCALSGMNTMEMVEENTETASNSTALSEKEVESINRLMEQNKKLAELYCTGCKYCMPCPQGVNIPYIFEQMNYYKVYGIHEHARNAYAEIGANEWIPGKQADACIDCGICEGKCPQKLDIREQLKESHEALSVI